MKEAGLVVVVLEKLVKMLFGVVIQTKKKQPRQLNFLIVKGLAG